MRDRNDLGPFETLLQEVESHFAVVLGDSARVREACRSLEEEFSRQTSPRLVSGSIRRLLPLLHKRRGDVAGALFAFLEGMLERVENPGEVLRAMLGARDVDLARRGLHHLLRLWPEGRVAVDPELAGALAAFLEGDPASRDDPAILVRVGEVLRNLSLTGLTQEIEDPLEGVMVAGSPLTLRHLAARVLDAGGEPVPPERVVRLLGDDAAAILAPYLSYTRAGHRDLVDLTPDGVLPPGLPDCLAEAERVLGRTLLGAVIGDLGWTRVVWGIHAERVSGISVDGSFPLAVPSAEAGLLEAAETARRVWDRFLIIAHGGTSSAERLDGGEEAVVQRFRRYNVLHAELLGEILEVAPVTPAKAKRILSRLDDVVGLFSSIFTDHAEDARRVGEVYGRLKERVLAQTGQAAPEQPLGAEPTRLIQMFEDPRNLDEVRTLHGLKRYLHQQGLRLAFRVFRSARATNRTVDLVLAAPGRSLQSVRRIRYIDFEPGSGQATGELPFAVSLMTEALGRRLLHGLADAPELELLIYGNEVQTFVNFRNHPAFVRMDLSPPLRGGMLDLEYFGVSQYELESHPDISLPWIQRIFRRLDFDAQADGVRLHIRYDKERAFDFGDLIMKARLLASLLPHLMDLDWIIGSLRLPETAKAAVADAWADWIVQWGVLPVPELLTSDRGGILSGMAADPAGAREIAWDGRGAYRDCFNSISRERFWPPIRAAIETGTPGPAIPWEDVRSSPATQLSLESRVLEPLREGDLTRRSHPAEDLATLLVDGGPALTEAVRVGAVAGSIERHLRFVTIGSVQGHPVQRSILLLRGERIELTVLRDGGGIVRLARAVGHPLHLWPGSRPPGGVPDKIELDAVELIRRLRRDNYLAAGDAPTVAEPPAPDSRAEEDGASLSAIFSVANPLAPPGPSPGDRIVPGIAASPGTAAGFVRFGTENATPDELDGAVLVAPAVRPADTPLLRRAAAVVSTGGGALSHAGLIALELHKPALVIAGRWRRDVGGRAVLSYRCLDYRENATRIGPYQVIRRCDLHEREEALHEGDLVVVDAEVGTLGVLGQDRDTLALQQELRQLETVTGSLARADEGSQVLVLRGRLLRAAHQLKRLLGRIDRPPLARHAVHELLRARDIAGPGAGRHGTRALLLQTLFRNPVCGAPAREAARRQEFELRSRLDALEAETIKAIGRAATPAETVFLRLGVLRLRRTLRAVTEVLRTIGAAADAGTRGHGEEIGGDGSGVGTAAPGERADIDVAARRRLEELRQDAIRSLSACSTDPQSWWRALHLRLRIELVDALLGDRPLAVSAFERPVPDPPMNLEELAGRRVIGCHDGGIELAPMIGAKGANLGEIARILGPEAVAPWFALTEVALQEVLRGSSGRAAAALGLDPNADLGCAVEAILQRKDWPAGRRAAAIRQLWQGTALPDHLVREIEAAYRALGPHGSPEAAPPYVAIRSSGFEEDTSRTSWAGQFDTFLYIRGRDALLEHLKLAWASLWSERAILHREAAGPLVDGGASAAGGIVVQRIVHSRAAGVLHTLAVATGQPREMVLNVGLGLGEGVVSGTVEVDHIVVSREAALDGGHLRFRYVVGDKGSQIVFDRGTGLGTKREETLYHQRLRPALEYTDLLEVVRAAARLEEAYGYPLDLEFAFEDGVLFILQARPIVVFQSALRETLERDPLASRQAQKEIDR